MLKNILGISVGISTGFAVAVLLLMYLNVDFSESASLTVPAESGTVTISYGVPNGDGINLDSLESVFQPKELPNTVVIPLTSNVVSSSYMTAFNSVVNDANKLETQMRLNVSAAMYDVQKEAEAGNYLAMFQKILEAKEVNKSAYSIAANLRVSTNGFKNLLNTESMPPNVSAASRTLAQDADDLSATSVALLDSLGKALTGGAPSQTLVDEIDGLSRNLIIDTENFARSLTATNNAIQQ